MKLIKKKGSKKFILKISQILNLLNDFQNLKTILIVSITSVYLITLQNILCTFKLCYINKP
jgi:hypothetical protein